MSFDEWLKQWRVGNTLYILDVLKQNDISKGIRLGLIEEVTPQGILVHMGAFGWQFVPWPQFPHWFVQRAE